MQREVQVRQSTGIPRITGEADRVAGDDLLPGRHEDAVQRQVRVEGDGSIVMFDSDEVSPVTVAVKGAVLCMNDRTVTCRGYDGADVHDEIVAILPEVRVPEAGAVRLVNLVGFTDGVRQHITRLCRRL